MMRQIADEVQPGGPGGPVTSVGLTVPSRQTVTGSPVTGAGTLAVTDKVQAVNLVFAGPASGPSAAPTFRSLVAADIPSLSATYLPLAGGTMTGVLQLPNGSAAAPVLTDGTTNSGIYFDGTGRVFISSNGVESFMVENQGIDIDNNSYVGTSGDPWLLCDANAIIPTFRNGTSGLFGIFGSGASGGSATQLQGLVFGLTMSGSSSADGVIQGINGNSNYSGSGTLTTAVGGIFVGQNTGSGKTTVAQGILATVNNTGGGNIPDAECISTQFTQTNGSTTTRSYGSLNQSPTLSGGSTITIAYGNYIAKQKISSGVTLGYGVYQADAADINAFAGKVSVGTVTSPTTTLNVGGSIGVSNSVVVDANGIQVFKAYAVAALPTGINAYSRAFATDSTVGIAAGLGNTPVGGGANKVPVYTTDGTNWLIG